MQAMVMKYLYVTTYQNDNYTFYEDNTDIIVEKEKLDKLL